MLEAKFGNDPFQHKVPSQLSPQSLPLLASYTTCITVYIVNCIYIYYCIYIYIYNLLGMKKHNV